MESIKVNLIPNGIPEACHASQYDEGRQIRLDLFDGFTPYVIKSGDTFTLNVRKPDNHVIVETITGTEGNTYLVIETSEQMTAVMGKNLCEIRVENDGDNIGSLNFIMEVEKDVIANGIPSESVIEDLESLVAEAVGDDFYTKSEVNDLVGGLIDDESTANNKTWSSEKIDEAVALKANKSDLTNVTMLNGNLSADTSIIETEITFTNAGELNSSGGISAKNDVYTSNFISLDNIKVIRVGKDNTKYNFLPYCFYTEANEESFISPRVSLGTNYDYSALYNHQYATEIDTSAYPTAKYIRISNSSSSNVGTKYYIEKTVYEYDVDGAFTSDITRALDKKIDDTQSEIDEITKQHSVILCRQYDSDILENTYVNPENGSESTATYDSSPFLPIKKGDILFLNYVQSMIFYNDKKAYITGFATNTITDYITDAENIYTVDVNNVAYMRVNFRHYDGYAVTKIDNDPFDVLNLGDSIFGLNVKPNDISTFAELKTHKKIANCGFGGTNASTHSQASYNSFCFCNLADAIYNENFSAQELYLPSINLATYTMNLRILKSVDFSKLRVITIAYGTNDWYNSSDALDNPNNKYDTSTYCGALRYGIEKLLDKYPKILLCLCSPIYRYLITEQEDGDTLVNYAGDTLKDYVEACENIAKEYHLPFFNHYYIGINKYNRATYLQQASTHLTYFDGARLVGDKLGGEINEIV